MATQSSIPAWVSIPAWRIPWTEEPGGLQLMGSQELDMTEQLSAHTHSGYGIIDGWSFITKNRSYTAFTAKRTKGLQLTQKKKMLCRMCYTVETLQWSSFEIFYSTVKVWTLVCLLY